MTCTLHSPHRLARLRIMLSIMSLAAGLWPPIGMMMSA